MVAKKLATLFKTAETITNSEFETIQSAKDLLIEHKKLIDDIYHHSHAPEAHFNELYLKSIEKLATWAQRLPASQNHHHAQTGGFLLHSLEVAKFALQRRNTKMLPVGDSVEKQNDKKEVWSFAVFVAALMHDIGKTITDIDVMLYNAKFKALGRWSPWHGDMLSIKSAKYYQHQYNVKRKYNQHGLLPLAFLKDFVVPEAITWIQKESELFTLLLMTIQGRYAEGGGVADIVKYADSHSCAQSLGAKVAKTNVSTNTAQPKSLADKLLDTIRYLLTETDIKINAPGAPVFTTKSDVFLVSKIFMDKIRDSLTQNKQTGIPYDNSRMMDELLQFHIIDPNTDGKAVWSTQVSGGGFKKSVKLTMLKMPISKVFINEQYPEPFLGEIKENGDTNKETKENQEASKSQDDAQTQITSSASSSGSNLPLPPGFNTAHGTDETNEGDTGEHNNKQAVDSATATSTTIPKLETSLGKSFLAWLVQMVNDRKLEINSKTAKVHVVLYQGDKALFLVSPKIFKEYDIKHWAQVQKQFGRLKINLKTSTDENIWKVQTKSNRTGKKPSTIKGYLIVNTEEHGIATLPDTNKHLSLNCEQ